MHAEHPSDFPAGGKPPCAVDGCDAPRRGNRSQCSLHWHGTKRDRRLRERERYPERRAAWAAVADAIKRGEIPRASELPCAGCAGQASEYDHVAGYAFEARLLVEPVCRPCHVGRMRRRRELAGVPEFERRPDAPVRRDPEAARQGQDAIREARLAYLRAPGRRPRRAARLATLGVTV